MLYIRKLFTQDLRDGKQIAFPKEPSYSFFSFDFVNKEVDRKISFVFSARFEQFQEYDGRVITTRLYAAGSEARMDGEVKAFIRDELNAKVNDLLIFKNKGSKHTEFEVMFVPQNNPYYLLLLNLCGGDNHSVYDFDDSHNEEIEIKKSLQQIFYGAPGTGKSHEVKKQTGELSVDDEDRDLPNVFRTTFHPDTDYASFVGCYKPSMRKTGKKHQVDGKDVDDEEIIYEFIPQTFTDAYVYAYKNPAEPTYLVIEEINRGNCAQIFGDLFQLLDRKNGVSEYRIKADKDLAKYLNEELGKDVDGIKDGKLRLPANLNILATMNTSDQSLFPIDSAFKRRWEWKYTPIAQGKDKHGNLMKWQIEGQGEDSWWTFIQGINEVIDVTTHSEDKKLGFFFCKDQDGVIKKETFVNKVVFYLWNDVFKVYGFKSEIFDKKGKDDKTEKITFKSFYKDDGSVNEETMSVFVKNVMAKAPKKNSNGDASNETEEISEESETEA